MDKQRLAFLISRYADNTITAAELDELSVYVHDAAAEPELLQALEQAGYAVTPVEVSADDKQRVYRQMVNSDEFINAGQKPGKVIRFNGWLKYAAAAVVVLGLGVSFYLFRPGPVVQNPVVKVTRNGDTIDMGTNKAILTLANGKRVVLNKDSSGTIALQADYRITQQQGTLQYKDVNISGDDTPLYNTITVPRGATYKVILADGTGVWLNTNSSLTYPVAFSGKTREVSINGEAYFEVAHDKAHPFIVNAAMGKVEVLGTHFNVNAYTGSAMATTLLSGSVKVSKDKVAAVIKPDQEAVINQSAKNITVTDVDASDAVAWRSGYFLFHNQNIKQVMETIARWYDVDIEYSGDMRDKTFGGTVTRFENIDKLLKSMELTGVIHFKKEGRRIIVIE